ncbi:MAG TPA: hypothetical protein PKO06_15845, partial [Candidatus Ozemobacteraceae bacterium]|nr:hypothetical protein [Candidatus Ozemobacteraceae bacterium]
SFLGTFVYQHIRQDLLWDNDAIVQDGQTAYIAEPEKAIRDLFHLHRRTVTPEYLDEMRLQKLRALSRCRLRYYAARFHLNFISEAADLMIARLKGTKPRKTSCSGSSNRCRRLGNILRRDFEAGGYSATVRERADKSVVVLEVSFSGVLRETRITPDPRKKLMIKVEIDTRLPRGSKTTVTLSNKYFPLALKHNDLETLLALAKTAA